MELPKNITQIGEPDLHCKVYVEDYVISYLKQVNKLGTEKNCAVALYGNCTQEGDNTYFFAYGGCRVENITGPVRHLSQAQKQETDKKRVKYFPAHQFIGYYLTDGNPIEGFYLCEQENCRYIKGYACFYEKNEAMLTYMLDHQETQPIPESYDREKFTRIRDRRKTNPDNTQSEMPQDQEEKPISGRKHAGRWGVAVAVLALAAGFTYAGMPGVGQESVQKIKQLWNDAVTPKTAESGEIATPVISDKIAKPLVADESLEQVILGENRQEKEEKDAEKETEATVPSTESDGDKIVEVTADPVTPAPAVPEKVEPVPAIENPESSTAESMEHTETTPVNGQIPEESYVIQAGDTLTSISTRQYGTISKVPVICEVNHIVDPDNIQIGQKIVLP